jgi:HSP20 family protein
LKERKKHNMKAVVQKESRPVAETAQPERFVTPEADIFETKDGYVLEAEMPGVSKDGLEITLDGTEITITGRPQRASLPGEYILRESAEVAYRRVFELDPAIDTSRINARMDQGLLTLSLPKSEKVKPRKITVE